MRLVKKWMTVLFSLMVLSLAGCGGGDQPFYDSGSAPVDPAAATYTLTALAQESSVVVGTTTTITAFLLDQDKLPVSGAPVTFVVDRGTLSGSLKTITVNTDTSGKAVATLTAPVQVGSGTVQVTYSDKSASVALTYLAGAAAYVTAGAPSPAAVGASSDSTLSVTVLDQYGNPLVGESMRFTITAANSGSPTLRNAGFATTDSNGVATVIYTSGTIAGAPGVIVDTISVEQFLYPTITATMDIQVLTSATSVTTLNLGLSTPSTAITVGTSTVTADATVLDNTGAAVAGVNVAFQIVGTGDFGGVKSVIVATDSSGLASATLNAPILVGSATITAATSGLSKTLNVSYIPDVPDSVTLSASPATVGVSTASTLVANLFDQYGNVTPNEPVTFTITANNSVGAVLSNPTGNAQTNSSGVASMTYTSGTTTGMTDTVQVAALNGTTPSANVGISVSASATVISSLNLALSSPTTAITVGSNTVTADATVLDSLGNPIAGVNVAFQIVGSGDFGGVKTVIVATNASGVASTTLNAPILVGGATITAASSGLSSNIAVTYIPDVPFAVTLSASPATVGVSTASTLTASLYDQYGNVTPNEPVTFSITVNNSVGAVLSNPTGNAQTNASGIATMTYTSGTTTGMTDTVSVTAVNGTPPTTSTGIDVSAAATAISSLNLALSSPTTAITVGSNTVTADATVLDSLGNPIAGVNVAFQIVGTGDFGGVKTVIVATNASGVAAATLSAPILVGNATITAASSGLSDNIAVSYIPDVPFAVTLSASPATVGVSTSSTLTAGLYDQYGNVTPNEPVTFAITANNSVGAVLSNPTGNAQTNASGIATMIYTSGTTTGVTDSVSVTAVNGTPPTTSSGIDVSAAATTISTLNLALSSPTSAITVGTNTVTADATILDNLGDPIAGVNVAFQIVGTGDFAGSKLVTALTNVSGVATVTLTAPDLVGNATINASAAGLTNSVSVTYIPDTPATVVLNASPMTVGASSNSTLTAVVYDQYGNVTANEPLTFGFIANGGGFTNPSGGYFTPSTGNAITNSSGVATIVYTSGTITGDADRVQVTVTNGTGPTDTVDVTVSTVATSVNSLTLALSTPSTSITVADNTVSAKATVLDALGAPAAGVDVAFQIVGSGDFAGVKLATATTDSSGIASVTLNAPNLVGSAVITATTAGLADSVSVTYISDVPASVMLNASLTTVGASSDSTLTAVVYDQYGNITANEPVTFSFVANGGGFTNPSGGHFTPSTGNAITNSSGVATMVYTSGTATGDADRVQVSVTNGTTPTATVDITVNALTIQIGSITVTSGSSSIIADGSSSTAIIARLIGMAGEPIAGQAVVFTTTAGVFTDGTAPNSATTTASTDSSGYAAVTLESSTDGVTPTSTGTAAVTATISGFSDSTTVDFIPGAVSKILMYVSPTTLPTGATMSFEAAVMDLNNNRITNEHVTFELLKESDFAGNPGVYDTIVNSFGGYSDSAGLISNTFGITSAYALDAGATTLQLKATTANGTTQTKVVTIDDNSVIIGGLTLSAANSSITADGVSITAVRAYVTDTSGAAVQGVSVTFTTDAGNLQDATPVVANTAVTNTSGMAELFLKSVTNLATATVSANIGGYNATTQVVFVAGSADPANSSITVSPATLPADGVSTATVTVTLADANSNPVSDGSMVTLLGMSGDARITSPNPDTTVSGRVSFTLVAASSSAVDTLYLAENSAITGSVTYGATGTGNPANIQVSSAATQIFVAGVGQTENTTVTVTLVDDAGSLIADPGYDNLRVTMLTKPNGGEYVSGVNNAGGTISSATSIDIVTSSGQAVFNVQSGTLPGIVELRIDVIDAVPVLTGVSAIVPQIVIASGPAHAINFTYPLTDAVINVGNGVYARKGSAVVSDRYGNAVVDGTVVNLGMIDTVIASDVDGDTVTSATALTSVATDLTTASVTRNGITRFIATNDRVLLLDAVAGDKSRFAASAATGADTLPVQTPYTGAETSRTYVVGATEMGATIAGVDGSGTLTPGYLSTTNGIGELRITYPANVDTILTGCNLAVPDARTIPADSGDIYVVGSVSDTDATTITTKFCLSAIAGATLTVLPSTIDSTTTVNLDLVDGGDTIPLPYVPVTTYVAITTNLGGLTVDATTAGCTNTDITGSCTATITVTGGATGDAATVTFYALDTSTTVSVTIP